ncbi:MAG: PUA domain-containing protein, partial [Planctomycetota bacterium]
DEARQLVRDDRSSTGVGGMATKLDAAAIASASGADAVIAPGVQRGVVAAIVNGERVGTRLAATGGTRARKRWLAAAARPKGTVQIDSGAAGALAKGASLLPAGVTRVDGDFRVGDVIAVVNESGVEVARGLASYASADAAAIAGKKSNEIEGQLGYVYAEELIHREDMHVFGTLGGRHE